jgi:L-seryl-tRNA(Ser) seleniumtransferase
MTLAALEATATAYLEGTEEKLPLWQMALASVEDIERRARSLVSALGRSAVATNVKAEAVPSQAVMGGGSLPGRSIGSWALGVSHSERPASEVERRLRTGRPPVVGRIEDDRVLLDLRSVPPREDETLLRALLEALS